MESVIPAPQDQVTDRLYKIYTSANRELLLEIKALIAPNAAHLTDHFYNHLMDIEESHPFLNHELVSERLHRSMAAWISALFSPSDVRSVAEHLKWQRIVGDVHARVNVPMKLVNHGIRLLKREMGEILKRSELDASQKYQGLVLINDLLDYSSSLINESYLGYRMENERDTQALRMHIMSFSMVVELERLRSSLFDWLRRTITRIYSKYPKENPQLESVYTSDFGLWVIYKAELLFTERPELVDRLKAILESIEENISKINQLEGLDTQVELTKAIEYLNEAISNAAWLVGDFSSQAYEMETGRDPLTRLFNRRFLPSVMQSMIKIAKSTTSTFSVFSCDLDDFKQINDRYGHDLGDQALKLFGEFLVSMVRATDYVFRMGGDEFFIILAGANAEISTSIAKKIIQKLKNQKFPLDSEVSIRLGASIGIIEYDGHPDYLRMLKSADEGLYKAKSLGKNTYFLAPF